MFFFTSPTPPHSASSPVFNRLLLNFQRVYFFTSFVVSVEKIIAYFDLSIKTEPNTDGREVIVSIIQQTYQLNNYIDKLSNYQIIFKSRYSA